MLYSILQTNQSTSVSKVEVLSSSKAFKRRVAYRVTIIISVSLKQHLKVLFKCWYIKLV